MRAAPPLSRPTAAMAGTFTRAVLAPADGGDGQRRCAIFGRVRNIPVFRCEQATLRPRPRLRPTPSGCSATTASRCAGPGATRSTDSGRILIHIPIPDEALGFVANGPSTQIVLTLTTEAEWPRQKVGGAEYRNAMRPTLRSAATPSPGGVVGPSHRGGLDSRRASSP